MSSPCGPQHAAAGDVGAALMVIDSRLKEIYDGKTGNAPEQQALNDQFAASLGPRGADDLLEARAR